MNSREVKKLLFDVQKACHRITDVGRIIAFRNRLIHGRANVTPQLVWGIMRDDVPTLVREVRSIVGGA
jgi:uncharacterized protein with HEPN domain